MNDLPQHVSLFEVFWQCVLPIAGLSMNELKALAMASCQGCGHVAGQFM
jgi:hypothetical protein